ncbi:hypothetical protein SLS56_005362 [Neofusicoccum ribis]|uniref:PH domain-containing protein n=1 Tax=Neofusicoccum ribis TaxID=45134 RepID=A0ABR3STU8_9PEZI
MRSLNRQRANIVMAHLLAYDKVLTPQQVSQKERIFELRDGALRWADDQVIGRCRIGVRLADVVARLPGAEAGGPSAARTTGAVVRDGATAKEMSLSTLLKVFEHESYVLWFDSARSEALIVLKQSCEPAAQLQAWTQALLLASRAGAVAAGGRRGVTATQTSAPQSAASQQGLRQAVRAAEQHDGSGVSAGDSSRDKLADVESELRLTLEQTRQMFGAGSGGAALRRLEAAGWDLSIAALETHSGTRAGVRTSLWPDKQ